MLRVIPRLPRKPRCHDVFTHRLQTDNDDDASGPHAMNQILGWVLALAAIAVGYLTQGWQGLVLAFTVIVFWLLLQFGRAMRVMRAAAESPVGHVASAVMLNAKLSAGMRLLEVTTLTRSLGQRLSESPEIYAWRDDGGATVEATFAAGRLVGWQLQRSKVG